MRKGLVYPLLVMFIFIFSILTVNMIIAQPGTTVSINPTLIQDGELKPTAGDTNSYPSTHAGTATLTTPTYAYDKNQATDATASLPAGTSTAWYSFDVKVFNATTIKSYSYIDIKMNYSVQMTSGAYKITLLVGTATYALQLSSSTNVVTPTVRTWEAMLEPNDGLWSAADLNNLIIRVEVRRTTTTGTCQFREYEAWATIQGDGFTFAVNVTDVPVAPNDLVGWQINITFNPLVLQCVTAYEGPFLKQAGSTYAITVVINNETGYVVVGTSLKSYTAGGVSGSGLLTTVAFKVINQGNSELAFMTDGTKLRAWDDVGGSLVPIPHTTVDSYFRSIQGDVNGDTEVNALDLYLLGRAYGATPAPPECDFDKNNIINSADLTTLQQNYGS